MDIFKNFQSVDLLIVFPVFNHRNFILPCMVDCSPVKWYVWGWRPLFAGYQLNFHILSVLLLGWPGEAGGRRCQFIHVPGLCLAGQALWWESGEPTSPEGQDAALGTDGPQVLGQDVSPGSDNSTSLTRPHWWYCNKVPCWLVTCKLLRYNLTSGNIKDYRHIRLTNDMQTFQALVGW